MRIFTSTSLGWPSQSVLAVFLLVSLVSSQDDEDPVRDRCARWHHAAMLRRDSIFIDGGVQLFRSNGTSWLGFNKYIYEIDMSHSWEVNTNYTESRIGRYANTSTAANPPNMLRGALYAAVLETNRLFTFGGSTFLANESDADWQPPSQDPTTLWSYDTEVRNWQAYNVSAAVPWRPNWGLVTEDMAHDVGFFLNGQYDRGSSYGLYTSVEYEGGNVTNASFAQISYLAGLVIIDLHSQETRNVSTDSLGAPRVAGGLVHSAGFGKTQNGTLVCFGGMRSSGGDVDTFTNGDVIDLSTISLCDSFMDDNVTWYNQTATGDVPSPRMDFCVLPLDKSPSDNSSFNFYLHGGYNPQTSTLYDDVYVLSLPSFTWTRVHGGNASAAGRFGHSCNAAANQQMLVTGGARDANLYAVETTGDVPADLNNATCNDGLGVSLFDLTNLTWGTFFNLEAPAYRVPRNVVEVIGGDGDGGATMTEPEGGFAHPAIWTMFHPPPPTSTSSDTSNDDDGQSIGGGAIAGAVVGSVAGVALAVFGGWFLLRRKRRQRRSSSTTSSSWRRRRRTWSFGTSTTISELQAGGPTEIHEKPAAPVSAHKPPVNDEPQELEAAERVELPAPGSDMLEKKLEKKEASPERAELPVGSVLRKFEKEKEERKKKEASPSPRQSAFVEHTEEKGEEGKGEGDKRSGGGGGGGGGDEETDRGRRGDDGRRDDGRRGNGDSWLDVN